MKNIQKDIVTAKSSHKYQGDWFLQHSLQAAWPIGQRTSRTRKKTGNGLQRIQYTVPEHADTLIPITYSTWKWLTVSRTLICGTSCLPVVDADTWNNCGRCELPYNRLQTELVICIVKHLISILPLAMLKCLNVCKQLENMNNTRKQRTSSGSFSTRCMGLMN